MIFLLYIGIIFIVMGVFIVIDDFYDIRILLSEKILTKKQQNNIDDLAKIKIVVGIFAIIVGILSIANYLIY